MVVNCLPLFVPRPENDTTNEATSEMNTTTKIASNDAHDTLQKKQARRGTKAAQRFVLQKASSTDSLLTLSSPQPNRSKHSSEAEDILSENGRNSVQVLRETWTHYNKSSYGIHGKGTTPVKSVSEAVSSTESVPLDKEVQVREEDEKKEVESVEGGGLRGEEVEGCDEADSASAQPLSDGGSDVEEERGVRVSFIESPEEMQTLKRSSGSVSFITTDPPAVRGRQHHPSPPPSVEEETVDKTEGRTSDGVEELSVSVEEGAGDGVREMFGSSENGEGVNGEIETTEVAHTVKKGAITHQEGDTEKVSLTQSTPSLTPSAPPPDTSYLTQSSIPLATQRMSEAKQPLVTPLPPPPVTHEPQYIERSGWLIKLSHRKGRVLIVNDIHS